MLKKLLLILLFLITASPALAISWPPEVKPEQGRASGTLGIGDDQLTVNIEFWNVGEVGGGEYGKATVELGCTNKMIGDWECVADENPPQTGTFSGGPNGKITIDGDTNIQLVNGTTFTSDLEKSFQATVENPEIFSKYRWSMDESIPIPEIKEGKYEVDTAGFAVFNDLYGQVEVSIPRPDGTYDEESWDFAKIDMKLPPGTRIKVSEKSGLMLAFTDNQTNITVGPDTEIVLVATDPQKSEIQLLWGNLKANVKKMMKDGSMEVEMSQAVAGIKGTQFILSDTKTESSIKVTEGTVKFTSKSTGKSVDVSEGESVTATSAGLSEKTSFDPSMEEKKWQEDEDSLEKTNTNIPGNKSIIYIVGGIIAVIALVTGILILKPRKTTSRK